MTKITKHAAGIILWRVSPSGREFLLLRNANHGTWGFPKGHREATEDDMTCALRELNEETGLSHVTIDSTFMESLSYEAKYQDGEPFDKVVCYFLGQLMSGEFSQSDEHNDGGWYEFDDGLALLQHEESRNLLVAAETVLELEQG